MVIKVVRPHPDRVPAGPLVGVGADALVAPGQGFHTAGEVPGSIVGAVVRDGPVDPFNPIGGEEGSRPGEEPDGGARTLVFESFGVGQAGASVHDRVQVGVSCSGSGPALGRFGGVGSAAVGGQAAAVGDLADPLNIEVDHKSAGQVARMRPGVLCAFPPCGVRSRSREIPSWCSHRPTVRRLIVTSRSSG